MWISGRLVRAAGADQFFVLELARFKRFAIDRRLGQPAHRA
jgi:hypothetical protein